MNRRFSILLLIGLAVSAFSGCAAPRVEAPQLVTDKLEIAPENDILTYRKVEPDKTPLIISVTGNIKPDALYAAFEAQNPDIQIISIDITGGNTATVPYAEWIKHGYLPDVMFTYLDWFDKFDAKTYFEDLSAWPVVARYHNQALQQASENGRIYMLPGPSEVSSMIYNKTLFERYGWEPPATFDEFVSLCLRIREESDGSIQPWNPNAKYSKELDSVLEGFTYEQLFGGVTNHTWYREFVDGNATFKGHMEPFYATVQTLIDNGLLKEEHFTYSATSRGKEFAAGEIAMINYKASFEFESPDYQFGFIPFPGTVGGEGYVITNFTYGLGIPRTERSEARKDAARRFIEYFSTPEAQKIFAGSSAMISSLKDVPAISEGLGAIQPAIESGRAFGYMDFKSTSGKTKNFFLYDDISAIVRGEMTAEQSIEGIDAAPYLPSAEGENAAPEAVGSAAEEFTILETSSLIADVYRDKAGADIGLIGNHTAFRGNLMRIFPGDINTSQVSVLKPRSFANESALVKVSMTGKQLLSALNDPRGADEASADCIYAFSGLKCTAAPWNAPGQRMLSVSLEDGTPIDENKAYTVACWDGTVFDKYITETLETYDCSFEELFTGYLKAHSPISPAKDGRITLVWE